MTDKVECAVIADYGKQFSHLILIFRYLQKSINKFETSVNQLHIFLNEVQLMISVIIIDIRNF